jgi:hypothetical protein
MPMVRDSGPESILTEKNQNSRENRFLTTYGTHPKTLLDTRKVFLEFLNQLKVPCEGRKLKYTITLIGPDPKLAARVSHLPSNFHSYILPLADWPNQTQKRQALRSLQAQHGQPEDIKEIDQKPRERLSGSSELLVSVDPDDSRRYVPLTSDRIALRACAIVSGLSPLFPLDDWPDPSISECNRLEMKMQPRPILQPPLHLNSKLVMNIEVSSKGAPALK